MNELSSELRSDAVPAVLRDAAHTLAGLLDGADKPGGEKLEGAIIINVSVAVAVGAPGKDQGANTDAEGVKPNDAVVIATAVATAPTAGKSKAEENPPTEGAS